MAYQKVRPFFSVMSEDMMNSFQDYAVTQIDFGKLRPNPLNAQTYDPIDRETLVALKDNIKEFGLRQPLLVKKSDNDTYNILSGHTRYTCIAMIREEEPGRFGKVPCNIWEGELSPAQERILLITQNIQRVKTAADVSREVEVIRNAYNEMIANGESPGMSAMEFVKACTSLSKTSAYRYVNINDNLSPELKSRFESGEMSVRTADLVASLPQDRQKIVAEGLVDKAKITEETVTRILEQKKKKESRISVSFTADELAVLIGPGKITKKVLRETIINALNAVKAAELREKYPNT